MKKSFFLILEILVFLFLISTKGKAEYNILKVNELTCESLVNPLGIDITHPHLSWKISSSERNQRQTAYQILVASSEALLENDLADLWNSSLIKSDQSILVQYAGKPLRSDMRCFWKVRVQDKQGNLSAWSIPAFWSMGPLSEENWQQARWIGIDRGIGDDRPNDIATRLAARYFRKEISIHKKIKNATVSFCGLGLSELYINGMKVGDAVLSPALTQYPEVGAYVTYDITKNLKEGANAFGVILGNGRYMAPRLKHEEAIWFAVPNYGFPKLILRALITFEDSSSTVLKSDYTWKITNNGPIIANNEFDGEEYDARKELTGWAEPGFKDSAWTASEHVSDGVKELKAQMIPPIRVTEKVKPRAVHSLGTNQYIIDMGQNMVGWVKLRVIAPAGTQIKMRFSELLKPEGSLYLDNIRSAKVTDIYTCKGDGVEVFEPRFTYHGFRYVELTGYPGVPDLSAIEGCVVHDDLEVTGSFSSSNETINQVFRNAIWGIKGNYRSIPTDCPQRDERQGWLGDRSVGARGESFVFNNAAFYAKWMDDIRQTQKKNGSLPDVVPIYWSRYTDDVTWPSSYLFITKMVYDQFGNTDVIERNYPSMKKWIAYMVNNYMVDSLFNNDTFGDWCLPPDDPYIINSSEPDKITSGPLLASSFFYEDLQLMKEFAALLHQENDITGYDQLRKGIYKAYNEKFFNKEKGFYGNNTVTSNVLSLSFGLVPQEWKKKVFEHIVDKTEGEFKGHISTGLIGGMFMMRTLSDYGRTDLAYQFATNKDYPSWGYMVEKGATTIWELWNGNTANPAMNSGNHVMLLGDLIIWYYEYLAGIQSSPGTQAFKEIQMRPRFPKGLNFVKASHQSPYGLVSSDWNISDGTLVWNVEVPVNTTAKIYFPLTNVKGIREGGIGADAVKDFSSVSVENGETVIKTGSGKYHFEVKIY
jgi:alpha-L-rhamnosidase